MNETNDNYRDGYNFAMRCKDFSHSTLMLSVRGLEPYFPHLWRNGYAAGFVDGVLDVVQGRVEV